MHRVECPCGSRKEYESCCEPLHLGRGSARTAEELMRSRYSAFSRGRIDYLISTLHPSRRQPADRESLARSVAGTQWLRLEVLETQKGREGDEEGRVEFVATYREGEVVKRLHERSFFVKEDGRWFYVSGEYENLRRLPEPGRNDPCWCGSGKKYKKCHG